MQLNHPMHLHVTDPVKKVKIWGQLFKLNEGVSQHCVNIYMLITATHQYFLLKKCEKFLQQSTHTFSTKVINIFDNKVLKFLTVYLLTSSLS